MACIDKASCGKENACDNIQIGDVVTVKETRGQGDGDPTRHMISIFHGCVPVFTLGDTRSTESDALPFEEVLPWERFSVRVPQSSLKELPATLHAA